MTLYYVPNENDIDQCVFDSLVSGEPLPIRNIRENLDLVPSSLEMASAEIALTNLLAREQLLTNLLEPIKENYDYILIDCTPSLGLLPINAFVAADSIIVPSQPRILSTKGLDLLLRTYSQVKRGINPDLKIDGILFTMVDARTVNDRSVIESISNYLMSTDGG